MGTWVDLSKELPGASSSPARTTPVPFGSESDYMRMLREAQVRPATSTATLKAAFSISFHCTGGECEHLG